MSTRIVLRRFGRGLMLGMALFVLPPIAVAAPPVERDRYVVSRTTGVVSKESDIRIRFARDVIRPARLGDAEPGLLTLTPAVPGGLRFVNPRELVLTPTQPLKSGQRYTAVLKTATLDGFPEKMPTYSFGFEVIEQAFDLELEGLQLPAGHEPSFTLRGVLVTADSDTAESVEKILTAAYLGKRVTIDWQHSEDRKRHAFEVRNLARSTGTNTLSLAWDGNPIGINKRGSRPVEVPPLGAFQVTAVQPVQEPAQNVTIRFSDTLDPAQDLTGLVTLGEYAVRTRIDGNTLTLYPARTLQGQTRLTVDAALRSARGVRLGKAVDETLRFEDPKPQVRFVGNGVVLPGTQVVSVPFEALNVHSVQVTAFRIYEDNIGQFLQANRLDGNRELGRVGRYLWRKTIALDEPTPNRWNRYAIDATDLLRKEPGGLYRLTISLDRGNSIYPCSAADAAVPVPAAEPLMDNEDLGVREASGWDGIETWYEDEYTPVNDNSNWNDRRNPCKDAYYRYNGSAVKAERNFMASNLGLLAKREPDGAMRIVASDLRTARPLPGVELELRNFQDRLVGLGRTDAAGFATVPVEGTPFYLVARQGNEVGYLKLSAGTALPISHFDVGGDKADKGIKGFIYGERGVWRPGDDIHLTFVLQDKQGVLPDDHPATLQLYSPKGQLMQSVVNAEPLGGFYAFTLRTPDDAPTGNWSAKVQLGGLTFTKELKVETVKPNRLKVELAFGTDALRRSGGDQPVTLFGQWLHGATAANLKADVAAVLAPVPTTFTRYADYVFDDPTREFHGDRTTLFEGALDADGYARFNAELAPGAEPPGKLQAHLTARVFESGGDFSVGRSSTPYHAFDRYVGIKLPKGDAARDMLLTDTDHSVEVATVDADGNPVAAERVQVTLYKVHWKWWWDQSGDSLAQYASASHSSRLQQDIISTRDGRGRWSFQVKYPSWGRYLVRACDLDGNHCTGRLVYIDWPGWAGRAQEQAGIGATMLALTADKERYSVGEKAVIQLPEASQGRALVSIETGNRILDQQWLELAPGKNRVTLPLTAAMSPTVYVSVTLLQPAEGKGNDRPIRLYGVVPLAVSDPGTHLKPELTAADEWKPESTVSVGVREAAGKPMTYTLAVVDEGLLGLTNFKTPDPHAHFYRKEALSIATWDLFDLVIGAYGGTLERLLALGGGDSEDEADERRKKRFPPVVKFMGPFHLAAGRSASHEVTLPRYLGAVRVMVVAGERGAYGTAEKSVFVRDALSMLATVPRVLGPGETVRVPVTLFAMDPKVKQATVTVTADGHFTPAGPTSHTVTFDQPGEKLGFFDLDVGSELGTGTLRFVAESGAFRSESEIHVPIRSATERTVRLTRAAIASGAVMDAQVLPHGLPGSNRISLEVAAVPPLNLHNRLGYLIRYPHGCVEQITSAVFPQLYLPALTGLDDQQKAELERNVNAGIERLRRYQNGEGGFMYWPGVGGSNDWATSYAGHFLTEAKRLGYFVPHEMYGAWLAHQQAQARGWTTGRDSSQLHQAYRLFTLALAGKPDIGAMNRLREQGLSPTSRWQLAAVFRLAGLTDAADDLIRGQPFVPGSYTVAGDTYGSTLRDRAIHLDALRLLGKGEQAGAVAREVSEALNSDQWLNTHAIAYSLYALSRYVLGADGEAFKYAYGIGGNEWQAVASAKPIDTVTLEGFPDAGANVRVRNDADKVLYASVIAEGLPAAGSEEAAAQGLAVEIAYTDLAGTAVDVGSLPQGSDIVARITVANTSPYDLKNLALTQIVPSGWEIHNPRFDGAQTATPAFDYQDIRDDRLYTYFALKRAESKTFQVLLNATYLGRFYLPGPSVEAMYEGKINARGKGKWVEVTAR